MSGCAFIRRLYCIQTTSTTAIAATLFAARREDHLLRGWLHARRRRDLGERALQRPQASALRHSHVPRIGSHQHTQRIANVANYSTSYYRSDGTFVGRRSSLAVGTLASGIWQRYDGTYPVDLVRACSGSRAPTRFGSVTSSCADWAYSDPRATGTEGLVNQIESMFWWAITPAIPCNSTRALYCIEQ